MNEDAAVVFEVDAVIGDAISNLTKVQEKLKETGQTAEKAGGETKQGAGKMSSGLDSLKGALLGLAGGFAVVTAGRKAWGLLMDGFEGIKEAEQSMNNLRNALSVQGVTADVVSKSLDEYAFKVQSTTKYNQDAVEGAMALGLNIGISADRIKDATEAAVNYASATGTSLEGAMRQLNITLDGKAGRLAKLVPELKGLTEEELRAGKAIDILRDKFKGMAEKEADTMSKQLEILHNNWGEVLESFVGGATGATDLKGALKQLNAFIVQSLPTIEEWGKRIGGWVANIAETVRWIGKLTTELGYLFETGESANENSIVSQKIAKQGEIDQQISKVSRLRDIVGELRKELEKETKDPGWWDTTNELKERLTYAESLLAPEERTLKALQSELGHITERAKELHEQGKMGRAQYEQEQKEREAAEKAAWAEADAQLKASRARADELRQEGDESKKNELTALEQYSALLDRQIQAQQLLHDMDQARSDISTQLKDKEIDRATSQSMLSKLSADELTAKKELVEVEAEMAKIRESIPKDVLDPSSGGIQLQNRHISEQTDLFSGKGEGGFRNDYIIEYTESLEHYKAVQAEVITVRKDAMLQGEEMTSSTLALAEAMVKVKESGLDVKEVMADGAFGLDIQLTEAQAQALRDMAQAQFDVETQLKEVRAEKIEQLNELAEATGRYTEALEQAEAAGIKLSDGETESIKMHAKDTAATKLNVGVKDMLTNAAKRAGQALIQQAASGKIALRELLHDTLKSLAMEAATRALFEVAAGFASMAMRDHEGATDHFHAAAEYGIVAAIAGAGAALTAGGGGGGGKGGEATPEAIGGEDRDTSTREEQQRQAAAQHHETYVFNGPIYGTTQEELARHLSQHQQRVRDESAGRDSARTGGP